MTDLGPKTLFAIIAICIGLVKIFRGPVADAVAARIKGTHVAAPNMELLAEVDALRSRLAEVEERLDFAERLLARVNAADQLPGGVQR